MLHAIYDRITVTGPEIVGAADPGGLRARIGAGAAEEVEMARPTGVGRATRAQERASRRAQEGASIERAF